MSESKYFAKVESGVVVRVVTVDDFSYVEDNPDRYGDASSYVETVFDDPAVRGAQVGDSYNQTVGFMSPSPFPSWQWDVAKLAWAPPVVLPSDAKTVTNMGGVVYNWSEETLAWVEAAAG